MELFKGKIEMEMKSRMALSDEQIKLIYNDDVFKLCGGCSSRHGWERIGEAFEEDFCQKCNKPSVLYYVE